MARIGGENCEQNAGKNSKHWFKKARDWRRAWMLKTCVLVENRLSTTVADYHSVSTFLFQFSPPKFHLHTIFSVENLRPISYFCEETNGP